jgi:hypothetical protein
MSELRAPIRPVGGTSPSASASAQSKLTESSHVAVG